MSKQQALKPQYFVTRQNGAMVPLIAMDELPIHVQIRGVSRILDPYDIGGMICVGVSESRHQYYVVEALNNTKPLVLERGNVSATTGQKMTEPVKTVAPVASTQMLPPPKPVTLSSTAPPKAFGIEERQPSDATSSSCTVSSVSGDGESKIAERGNNQNASPDADTSTAAKETQQRQDQGDIGQTKTPVGSKEYCSFWIRRGECDYAQQGCVYKHEMPLDLPTLERIGHRDIPRWYREKYALGSLLVAGGKNGPSFGVADPNATQRNWRVSDDAKRMICHGLGVSSAGRGGAYNYRYRTKNHAFAKDRIHETEKKTAPTAKEVDKEKERRKEAIALKLNEIEEKERKALAAKYKVLRPDHRSVFDHDLDSETFSNGEAPNDLMAQIRAKEQAGWEEEKAKALAATLDASGGSSITSGKQTDLGKGMRGGRRRGGGRRRRT
ncbi:hypothetical protein KCU88_g3706, partial [Aureobasidium melanogenum]